MARIIDTIRDKEYGYESKIIEDDDGRVHFVANGSIDADGANGQHGNPAAYRVDNLGTENLENGGMRRNHAGKVVCINDDARDIVILGDDNEPKEFPGGIIASMTAYKYPDFDEDDPRAYVDAETVPYMVVPHLVAAKTAGMVLGCLGRITFEGRSIDCVVADLSSDERVGELSIAAARELGINPSPRHGGHETPDIQYELWPGRAADGFTLQPL